MANIWLKVPSWANSVKMKIVWWQAKWTIHPLTRNLQSTGKWVFHDGTHRQTDTVTVDLISLRADSGKIYTEIEIDPHLEAFKLNKKIAQWSKKTVKSLLLLKVTVDVLHVRFYVPLVTCHMLHVMCDLLHVICDMVYIRCFISHIKCHMLVLTFHMTHMILYTIYYICYMLPVTCHLLHVLCYMLCCMSCFMWLLCNWICGLQIMATKSRWFLSVWMIPKRSTQSSLFLKKLHKFLYALLKLHGCIVWSSLV